MSAKLLKFCDSADGHQLRPVNHMALFVQLTQSDNNAIQYPALGVLHIWEVGVDLQINNAIFHHLEADGRLGAPVVARNPVFNYRQRSI